MSARLHRQPRFGRSHGIRRASNARQRRRRLATWSPGWRLTRAAVIARDIVCQNCAVGFGPLSPAEVDHIDNDPGNDDMANLQALCKSCHSRKTAAECGLGGSTAAARP